MVPRLQQVWSRPLDAMAELEALLAMPDCRLVSIVGPGGIGKTRLALALAHRLQRGFDAVALAALASLERAVDLPAVAVAAFGLITPPGGDPIDVLRQLNGRALLVLDNFEQLVEGADFLCRILEAAPAVKLLVTSRIRLQLAEEWIYDLDRLPLPPADEEGWAANSAVQLFVQSARRVRAGFGLERPRRRFGDLAAPITACVRPAGSSVNADDCDDTQPEVHPEASIAFEHGDILRPFVIGMLWNGRDKPPLTTTQAVGGGKVNQRAVSYTHLTLPTSDLV